MTVLKVNNGISQTDRPKNFPYDARLYLELLENKTKIKQSVINKDHDPSSPLSEHPDIEQTESFDPIEVEAESDGGSIWGNESDNLDTRMQELLEDDNHSVHNKPMSVQDRQYKATPPPLSQLKHGHLNIDAPLQDINQIDYSREDEEELKRDLLFKFESMRKNYPDMPGDIPEFSMHSDYKLMQKTYDSTLRHGTLDTSVESYRKYLMYTFTGIEFVGGQYLNFDMEGYAKMQANSMPEYDKLLVELGEKRYTPLESQYSVEIRLMMLILVQTGMFLVGKIMKNKMGKDITATMQVPAPSASGSKKMKGPSNFDDDFQDLTD